MDETKRRRLLDHLEEEMDGKDMGPEFRRVNRAAVECMAIVLETCKTSAESSCAIHMAETLLRDFTDTITERTPLGRHILKTAMEEHGKECGCTSGTIVAESVEEALQKMEELTGKPVPREVEERLREIADLHRPKTSGPGR